jgi:type IV pilus assembly protein PilY1
MKKIQAQGFLALLALVLMGYSATLRAEDTDIYVDNAGTAGVPNILFVIDTSASFSSNADACTYASGGSPSLGNTAGGIEQCALVDAIESLPDSAVNMGIMVTNTNGFAEDVRSTSDIAFHETCQGNAGGCLVRKLTLMDAAAKVSLVNFIKSWKDSGQSSATSFNVKSSTTRSGGMMQEAWAYYHGKIGQSTKNYATSIVGTGCQKNFVIFIGNAFGNSGTPGDGTVSPYSDAYGMTDSQTGATTAQKTKISETVSFSPATCGVSSIAASTNTSDWSENWADEWARLMYQQDGGTSTQEGTQNIITYSVGVVSPTNSCKPDYPALLTTMAKHGGGKYFQTGNASEVVTALTTILNEVQAVNSVFSSASLPVSVNAEGSYLNQIYLGMFRPDPTGSPRWLGNLKQYKAIKTSTGSLVMGDAVGNPAISSAGTGFISPNAVSYWTKKDTTQAPDDAATGRAGSGRTS